MSLTAFETRVEAGDTLAFFYFVNLKKRSMNIFMYECIKYDTLLLPPPSCSRFFIARVLHDYLAPNMLESVP